MCTGHFNVDDPSELTTPPPPPTTQPAAILVIETSLSTQMSMKQLCLYHGKKGFGGDFVIKFLSDFLDHKVAKNKILRDLMASLNT